MYLHHLVIDHGDVSYVHGIRVQETVEGLRVLKGLELGFVEALSKLAPHGVEHEFSEGTQAGILLNFVILQLDAFMLEILLDVVLFGFL